MPDEDATGYALVLNQLLSHRGKVETREFLKSLTLFKFFLPKIILYARIPKRRKEMNTKSVKLIKRHERIPRRRRAMVELIAGPNRWSKSVRSWVVEFQERDRSESLPAFDSLFKDSLPQAEGTV